LAAHHDSSEYNVQYKRNKSSDTELLPGASILAIHTPTGSRYSALSNGRFSMLNMKVGGPYKVMITFIGFHSGNK
jgi:hypothetical protein